MNAAWLKYGKWHKAQVGTENRLLRIGWARIAREKNHSLYVCYGPPIPEHVIVTGYGPYPSKGSVRAGASTDRVGDETL